MHHHIDQTQGDQIEPVKGVEIAQQIRRANVWARESVSELVLRARRDAGGAELRTLADRMGLLAAL